MIEAKNLFEFFQEFFNELYNPQHKEHGTKPTKGILSTLAQQVEFFMSQNYLNPATVKERLQAVVVLNDELQKCLRIAVENARQIYFSLCKNEGLSDEEFLKLWKEKISDEPWIKIFEMLDALDLHDPKQKEIYDAELENNGH